MRNMTANPTAQARLRDKEKNDQQLLAESMKEIMALPAGRRVLYDLIFVRCGLLSVYGGQDSGIYRHEGRRGLGAELVQDLQENHTSMYVLMVAERMQEQKLDKGYRDAVQIDSQETTDE